MMVTWLSPEAAEVLFAELQQHAPTLVKDGGWRTSVEYRWWSQQEPWHVIRYPEAIVLVGHWYRGLRAEIHPIILDWPRVRLCLGWFFRDLMDQLNVERLEFRMRWPSRSLKRFMLAAGCQYEGTARKSEWSHKTGSAALIDVELWSILKADLQGDSNGYD